MAYDPWAFGGYGFGGSSFGLRNPGWTPTDFGLTLGARNPGDDPYVRGPMSDGVSNFTWGGLFDSIKNLPWGKILPTANIIPTILSGTAGVLANTQGARTGTSLATTSFNEPPAYAAFGDLLRGRMMDRLKSATDLSGYQASGIGAINDAYGGVQQALNAALTGRGLGTSPVAGNAETKLQLGRAGEITNFLNTLPLLQRQLEGQDLAQAANIYNARPLDRTVSATEVSPGSAVAGGLTSAAAMLAYLNGLGIMK